MKLRFVTALFLTTQALQGSANDFSPSPAPRQSIDKKGASQVRCARKSPTISEEKAVAIAKGEILKNIGKKESDGYSRYFANWDRQSGRWSVIANPDSRVIDEQILVVLNMCGQVLSYKAGL